MLVLSDTNYQLLLCQCVNKYVFNNANLWLNIAFLQKRIAIIYLSVR
jgi:hypothetical protein